MAKKLYEESDIQSIANAIREKNGTTNTYKVSEMKSAINNISAGSSDLEESFIGVIDRTMANPTLPDGLTSISNYAFYRNTTLKKIPYYHQV